MAADNSTATSNDDPVIFKEIATSNGRLIGQIILNAPAKLNALTLEMVDLILLKLTQWQYDDNLVLVLMSGSGDKAFCAGGDVQALYQAAKNINNGGKAANEGHGDEIAAHFFEREYRLDYLLHTYSKPIITWGHGFIMGGGLGIFAGCQHRVVTEQTRLAMPESSIGLYPDVGGSYFLNKMPGKTGLFLALTGAALNAIDSCYVGLADYSIEHSQFNDSLNALIAIEWQTSASANNVLIQLALDKLSVASTPLMPAGHIEQHFDTINQLCNNKYLSDIVSAISDFQTDNAWLTKAQANLAYASPLSLAISAKQLKESEQQSLKTIFNNELVLSRNLARHSEFIEGVRALLIDKDKQPQWQFQSVDDIPTAFIDSFFTSPWQKNPLANL
ncbi:MAG TPA: enoyl-CoA hydratase/isomerase family protein [Cellvibrionales bacterium]|nr:enoyl-CoA hydratase/isomerase family protein [Cellvibrionales bacterium]